jgi:hypothetical protein
MTIWYLSVFLVLPHCVVVDLRGMSFFVAIIACSVTFVYNFALNYTLSEMKNSVHDLKW